VTEADLLPGGASAPDLGRPREEAAIDALRRCAATGPVGRFALADPADPIDLAGLTDLAGLEPDEERPDLVVLIEHGAADAGRADQLVSSDVPHLSVVVREDNVVVGPLVRPGDGPCLRCLDLHRGDRDCEWPSVLTQVLNPTADVPQPEETAVSILAAGLAALQVLGHLDGVGEPAAAGATLEVELPDGLIARRAWPAHPRCGCHWPPRQTRMRRATDRPAAARATGPPTTRPGRAAGRMGS
jgi:bacteriocin biosynthesis cyclodehydratase domain-containing protein